MVPEGQQQQKSPEPSPQIQSPFVRLEDQSFTHIQHTPVYKPAKAMPIRRNGSGLHTNQSNSSCQPIASNSCQPIASNIVNTTSKHITFTEQQKRQNISGPGVGNYDISIPIVKPAYQTYEKNTNVVLVKINHIGGTSSFCSDQDRFTDRQNGYTPGPGTYNTLTSSNPENNRNSNSKAKEGHHQNYNLISQMLKQSREKAESIPSYNIPAKRAAKYNGVPGHLQRMYQQLDRKKEREVNYQPVALPLEYFIKLKTMRREILPVPSSRYDPPSASRYDPVPPKSNQYDPLTSALDGHSAGHGLVGQSASYSHNPKYTETMHRLQKQRQIQTERSSKIRSILGGKQKDARLGSTRQVQKVSPKYIYNQNMVNMLYGHNRRQSCSSRVYLGQ